MALIAVWVYGLSAFAQKTEAQVRLTTEHELHRAGFAWAAVTAHGQHVVLSGNAPSLAAADQAVRTASATRCASWLGPLPCVQKVSAAFTDPSPFAPEQAEPAASPRADAAGAHSAGTYSAGTYSAGPNRTPSLAETAAPGKPSDAPADQPPESASPQEPAPANADVYQLRLERKGGSLDVSGAMPDAPREALDSMIRVHFPSGQRNTRVSPRGTASSPAWDQAVTYAIEVAARCEEGVVVLEQNVIDVDCETQTASAKEALTSVLAKRPDGLNSGTINVLAVDEVKSCEAALVKLATRSQIRFTTNSAKLLPTSRPLLREIAHQLERCPGIVVVEGHTDAQGLREENITLSLNRARAVVSGLVELGVPATRVRAEGFGPDKPLATNDTATGRAQNRRIEFRVARNRIRGD